MAENLNSFLCGKFNIEQKDIRTYSPLTLAYIGDCIFDVVIRSILVNKGNTVVNKLHVRASGIVNARVQSEMVKALMDDLTEEEISYYKRGRNAKPHSKAKHASTSEYLDATGFEALLGFLYLTDQMDRVCEICQLGIDKLELDILKD